MKKFWKILLYILSDPANCAGVNATYVDITRVTAVSEGVQFDSALSQTDFGILSVVSANVQIDSALSRTAFSLAQWCLEFCSAWPELHGPPRAWISTYLDNLACLSAVLDCVVLYSALSQTALRAVQCCLRLSSAWFSAVLADCFQLDSARYPSVFNLTAFGLIPPCSRQRSSWT